MELKTIGSTWAHLRGPEPPDRVERSAGSEPPLVKINAPVQEPRRRSFENMDIARGCVWREMKGYAPVRP